MIERGILDLGQMSDERKKRGVGINKRSIGNHKHLKELVGKHLRPSFDFVNIKLEDMSLPDQIMLFSQTALIIAQHGAGLTNCIWMESGRFVIEISNNRNKRHDQRLCNFNGIRHINFISKQNHTVVDLPRFNK